MNTRLSPKILGLVILAIIILVAILWYSQTKVDTQIPSNETVTQSLDSEDKPSLDNSPNTEQQNTQPVTDKILKDKRSHPEIASYNIGHYFISDYSGTPTPLESKYLQIEIKGGGYVRLSPFTSEYFPEVINAQNQLNPNSIVEIFKTSQDKKTLILATTNDSPTKIGTLFKYVIPTGEITPLTISNFISNGIGGTYETIAMPTYEDKFLFVPNLQTENGLNQRLYIVDALNDTYQLYKQLEGQESFNAGSYLNPVFDMTSQLDGYAVRVAIFDRALLRSNYNPASDKGRTIVKTFYDWRLP